jgi:predicted PurR-regulated permease PerM
MLLLDPKTARVLITLLLFAAVLGFAWAARATLIAFLFAIFFAHLVSPLVEYAQNRAKISRGLAIAIIYIVISAALGLLLLSVGPKLVHEGQKLSVTIPDLYARITTGQIAWTVGSQHGWSRETIQKIQAFMAAHRDTITRAALDFGAKLSEVAKNAWWLVVIPVLAVFFLKDGSKLRTLVIDLFERRSQRDFVEGLINDIDRILAHYIQAQLILAGLTGVVFCITLTITRVPYGYGLGAIAGCLEFIPIVGPLVAALLIVGVALATGYKHLLLLIAFLAVWRVIQDYVNAPRIMGRQVEVHPLAALFGILAGAEVAGIIGVYLSIPAIATLRILWRRWRAPSAAPSPVAAGEHISVSESSEGNRAE